MLTDFDAFNPAPVAAGRHHEIHDSPLDHVVQLAVPEPVKAETEPAATETTSSASDHLEEVDKW
jgi:hypothetical protein